MLTPIAIGIAIAAGFVLAANLIMRHRATADPHPPCSCGHPTLPRIIHRADTCAFVDCPMCDSTGIVTTSPDGHPVICWCANGDAAITRGCYGPRATRPVNSEA